MKRIFSSLIFVATLCAMVLPVCAQNVARATFTSASGTAYTAGDVVGSAVTLAGVRKSPKDSVNAFASLDSLFIKDETNQKAALTIKFFQASAPSVTDNAAFAYAGSDYDNEIYSLDIAASDYVTTNGKATVSLSLLGIVMGADAGRDMYVVVITTGTPTYGAAKKLVIDFGFKN